MTLVGNTLYEYKSVGLIPSFNNVSLPRDKGKQISWLSSLNVKFKTTYEKIFRAYWTLYLTLMYFEITRAQKSPMFDVRGHITPNTKYKRTNNSYVYYQRANNTIL